MSNIEDKNLVEGGESDLVGKTRAKIDDLGLPQESLTEEDLAWIKETEFKLDDYLYDQHLERDIQFELVAEGQYDFETNNKLIVNVFYPDRDDLNKVELLSVSFQKGKKEIPLTSNQQVQILEILAKKIKALPEKNGIKNDLAHVFEADSNFAVDLPRRTEERKKEYDSMEKLPTPLDDEYYDFLGDD